MSESIAHPRSIRSYVRRDSRMTKAQKNAIESHWDYFGINYADQTLDLNTAFLRTAPKILDIGAGMGDSTLTLAKRNPENDYLAVEVHLPGVGSLIHKANKLALTNIRIIVHDVLDVLDHQLAVNSIDSIYIFFPDPWHKKRHHKRRLINQAFFKKLLSVLKPHGRIFIATDWQDYAEHIVTVSKEINHLVNLASDNLFAPRPDWRPYTKFEKRGMGLQHQVWDFVFAKNSH